MIQGAFNMEIMIWIIQNQLKSQILNVRLVKPFTVNLYRIDNASCTCPAGLGEACSHISAVRYAVVMPWSQGFAGKSYIRCQQ